MISQTAISEEIRRLFAEIRFPEQPEGLYDPLRYMISIGGKRLRPAICLTAYSLYKDSFDESVLEPAAALEVFHTFTLIHDDIMDKSPMRRGMPTVWTKWNDDTAILSGDVMQIDAYKRLVKVPADKLDKALDLFSRTAAEVCEGQQYDMDFENLKEVPRADYEKMIGLKTAVLIACAAKMGALIAGASDNDCDAIYEYGYRLGMAFQIADDYLDAFGDAKVFGKPIGGDIVQNKKSWLTVRTLEKVQDKEAFFAAMAAPADTQEQRQHKIATVKAVYSSLGVDEDAKAEIVRFSNKAMDAVNDFGSAEKEVLKQFADNLVGRAK